MLDLKNKKSFLFKLLLNSVLVTFILLTSVNALAFSVLYMNFKANEETHIQNNLEKYINQYKIVENNAITKSASIAQNLNIIGTLNSSFDEVSDKYELFLDMHSYINSFYDDTVESITIYSANSSLFQGEYIENIEKIKGSYAYENLSNTNFMFIDSNLFKLKDGRLCFSVYHKIDISYETIVRITMFVPEKDISAQNIILTDDLSQYSKTEYLNIPINDKWYAVSGLNTTKMGAQKLFYVFLFFVVEIVLLLISLLITKKINKKTVDAINELVEYTSLNYSESLNAAFLNEASEFSEVEQIKDSIRNLILKIQEISKEKTDIELEKKNVSLKLLQSKMNPHFLYNILSVISYRELKKQDTETVKIINEMVSYYRMILSKGKDYVSVKEELELIKKYVFLAEISHSKKYELEIDVPDDMNAITIPHMLLQPFVENSIIHGLSGSRENCLISIKGHMENDLLVFTIYDNGYGMNEDTLYKMNNITEASTNYGIKNTYERMKLIYGYNFSISYESVQNKYTEVTVKFSKSSQTED